MNMHWVTGRVNLSGQGLYIIDIRVNDPISWPHAQALMALHGEENVYEIKPVYISETSPRAEKDRLFAVLNGNLIVEQVFPGRTPRMEMTVPGFAEDQPRCDNEGRPLVATVSVPVGGNGDDEDDDETADAAGREPPTEKAVFSPGRHRPPASA